jgi:hypothetical protein
MKHPKSNAPVDAMFADEKRLASDLQTLGEVPTKEQAASEAARLIAQPVPDNVFNAVTLYVAIMRKKGKKERTIRRLVLRKFNVRLCEKGQSSLKIV